MNSPKITVITPSYNQVEFIEESIRSVVEQDYSQIEYLIMDGGSTDGSVNIIREYAQKYPGIIKWSSGKDKGQVDALNRGLKLATGDIISYLNSDDYYLPGAFKMVNEYFSRYSNKLWLVGNCRVSDPKLSWTFLLKHIWPIGKFPWALHVYNTVNQPAVFLRRGLVKKVGLFNPAYHYAFDYDYWLRCLKFGLPGRHFKDLAVFRVHSGSKGNRGYEAQFKEDLAVAHNYSSGKLILNLHSLATKFLTLKGYHMLK